MALASTSSGAVTDLDQALTDASFFADPYSVYRRLRTESPVYWSESLRSWLLTRHADVRVALLDERLSGRRTGAFMDEHLPRDWQDAVSPLRAQLTSFIGFSDPPDHTRLRRAVNRAFGTGVVKRMQPRIEQILSELVEPMREANQADLVRDLAFPLPAIVIAETLGVPAADRHRFKQWADDFVPFITAGQLTLAAMREYLSVVAARKRREPANDLLSALLVADTDRDRLTEEELLSMCMTMLIGGHETTTNAIANGILALLRHPRQRRLLIEAPARIGIAVEELLRFDAPLQRTFRIATQEIEIGDAVVRRGQVVSMMLGAANRDPAICADPDALDVTRPPNRHLSFGQGIHYCVGAPLARLETVLAITTLLRDFPLMALASEALEYQPTFGLRALRALPVVLS